MQTIPASLQPNPDKYDFDLRSTLDSIVSVRTRIPDTALTAPILGTEREGHGVLIGNDGLILTIGYVITEAESVWLVDFSGVSVQGYVVGYDQQSGFGLVRALGAIGRRPLAFGDSDSLTKGSRLILAGAGGVASCLEVSLASVREFAGYWEYLLEKAFFTAPAHPSWGGAALIGSDGKLYGIGSLILQTADQHGNEGSANMVIPIHNLDGILDEVIRFGKRDGPSRPWLGWYVQQAREGVVVSGLVEDGPADSAGVLPGDIVKGINGVSAPTLAEMYRLIWGSGYAGTQLQISIARDGERQTLALQSIDRNAMLASPSVH